jgi:hypothetical protein
LIDVERQYRPSPGCLAGDVVSLEPYAVWILEQHRIITFGPRPFLRRVDDARADEQELVQRIDVGAARPETR